MLNLAHKHFIAAAVWCILLGIAYLVMDSQMKPKVATVLGMPTEVSIPRSRDGHFYVVGNINGLPVTFMVDTGASVVAVNQALANRLGLPKGSPAMVSTAGGQVSAEEVTGQRIAIGGLTVNEARILVIPSMASEGLLGQNVLRHLEVNQLPDRMVLRAKTR